MQTSRIQVAKLLVYQNCEPRKNNCTSFASKGNPETDDKRDEELEKQESKWPNKLS